MKRLNLTPRSVLTVFTVLAVFVVTSSCKKNKADGTGNSGEHVREELHMTIDVVSVTESTVRYSVDATPEDSSYICGVVPQSDFSAFSSPEEFLRKYLAGIRDAAEAEGHDAVSALNSMLIRGSSEHSLSNLAASSGYVVFAAGVNSDYSIMSDVVYALFSTQGAEKSPLFSFLPELQGLEAAVTVVPSDEIGDMYYYCVIVDKSVLNWKYGGPDNLQPGYEANFKKTIEELVGDMKYGSISKAVASVCWKGTGTFPVRKMIPDTDYYIIAAGIDESTGNLKTEVCHEVFRSNKGGNLKGFKIDFRIGKINGDMVEVEAIPSDNMVRYYFDRMDPESADEDIIPSLYSLIDEYVGNGVIADANGFYSQKCSVGPDRSTYTGLEKGTYRIYGFGIDNAGLVATDLMFSEEFTVGQ